MIEMNAIRDMHEHNGVTVSVVLHPQYLVKKKFAEQAQVRMHVGYYAFIENTSFFLSLHMSYQE